MLLSVEYLLFLLVCSDVDSFFVEYSLKMKKYQSLIFPSSFSSSSSSFINFFGLLLLFTLYLFLPT